MVKKSRKMWCKMPVSDINKNASYFRRRAPLWAVVKSYYNQCRYFKKQNGFVERNVFPSVM